MTAMMAGIKAQFELRAYIKAVFLAKSSFIVSVLALYGCSHKDEFQQIEFGQKFKTRLGQYNTTPDKDFTFSVSKIIEDSRGSCPKNTVCVWDGQLLVQLEYSQNPESRTKNHRDALQFREEKFEDYTVEILRVHPKRQPKNHKKYRFTIEVNQVDID